MSTLSVHSRRSGFSLIEVAIALSIFVVGALAIVRIFPPALGVIRNNENRATATQLGETMLARMSAKNSLPPEAIYDVSLPNTKPVWNDYAAAVVGTINTNLSLPSSPSDTSSALDHFRYIYGEPHYIGAGKTVMLNYPYDDSLGNLSFFTDEIIEGVQVRSNGDLDFSNATNETTGSSFSDPSNPELPISRGSDFTYYVSYHWHASISGSPINGVIEEPLVIPTAILPLPRVFACSFITSNRAVPGGARVKMRRSIPLALLSTFNFTPTLLNFVGQGKGYSIQNNNTSSAMLYCSYSTKDWRNIVTDGIATSNIVNLPINGVDTNNLIGVLSYSDQTVAPMTKLPDLSTSVKQKKAEKGSVEFTASSGTGARFRTIYKTLDGWANQPSVAPRSYIPYDAMRSNIAGNFPTEQWREYVLSADGKTIYFHPSEVGKTVSVSYQNGSGTAVNGVILTIKNTEQNITLPVGFFGSANSTKKLVAPVDITDLSGNPVAASTILSIQGLSIQARTAWQNGDRYEQVIVPGYRALMP